MYVMNERLLKDLLYEQVARIGKAASSPKRLELLELLAQGEKTVETLASELSADIKLTSAHLKVLKEARLVTFRREGKYIIYQLAGSDVAGLWVSLRQVAEEHLLELKMALGQMVIDPAKFSAVNREVLLEQADAARCSSSMCVRQKNTKRLTCRLPARCRWPRLSSALLNCRPTSRLSPTAEARSACSLTRPWRCSAAKGYRVRKILDGVSEWLAAGLPVEQGKS
jgi:DNA-binding transcriptional ArsR family regulator